jgi:tetratricopeptide (TPR) repeat protein
MPQRGAQDVAHVAYTDHRIQTPGKTPPVKPRGLQPWRRTDRFERRNLGLALFEWGTTVRDVNTLQEAFRILIDLPRQEKDAPVLSALGNLAIQKGRPAEARTWLAEAARLDPNNAQARMALGRAEQQNGANTEALRQYEEAIRLDSLYFDAYVLAAQIHRAAGDRQAYRQVLQRYLRHVPGSLAARKALAAAP